MRNNFYKQFIVSAVMAVALMLSAGIPVSGAMMQDRQKTPPLRPRQDPKQQEIQKQQEVRQQEEIRRTEQNEIRTETRKGPAVLPTPPRGRAPAILQPQPKPIPQQRQREIQEERSKVYNQSEQERVRLERTTEYENRWADWQTMQQNREQELRKDGRHEYLKYQERYRNRIREDRELLGTARYYDRYVNDYRFWWISTYYYTSHYGVVMIEEAIRRGYEEGYLAGRADKLDGWGYNPYSSFAYMDAFYGYNSYFIPMDVYSYYFREGFIRGYEDGYYERWNNGRYMNGIFEIHYPVLRSIFYYIRF